MALYPIRYRLPQSYYTEIGRIVTRFAYLEAQLNRCAYLLLRINPKQGRVAVRLGRMESALTALEDLIAISDLTIKTNIQRLKTPLRNLEKSRDMLSHGIWVKHGTSSNPGLQGTTGYYSDTLNGKKSKKARIDPIAIDVTLIDLRKTVKAIDSAVRAVTQLGHEIVQGLTPPSG